jgi:DNA ligase 1
MNGLKMHIFLPFLVALLFATPLSLDAKELPPQIQLANVYRQNVEIGKYLVSEKLDGVRAYWDGKNLISRHGNVFKAPRWFVENFPKTHLEGELWIGRGKFQETLSIIQKEKIDEDGWKKVRLMLFDMPKHGGEFSQRFNEMKKLAAISNSQYLQAIEQVEISSHKNLMNLLAKITKEGGEGIMLHRRDSLYKPERNDDILKLKSYEEGDAKVISHIAGKGKFEGMMGAILVENEEKIRFKIGSGFSLEQRKSPPAIGSLINYKFNGKTNAGKPRFASFICEKSVY